MAIAVTGPMPGIVIRRAVSSSSRALARSSRSNPSIFSSNSSILPNSSLPSSTTASGRPQSPFSSTEANCLIRAVPWGATTPYSARWPRSALIICARWRTSRSRV